MRKVELLLSFLMIFALTSMLAAGEAPLINNGGTYELPVRINGVITLNFIVDSGAAEVNIPSDVVLTLIRARTINKSDFLDGKEYVLADGSTVKSPRFIIRELEVGGQKLHNIPASIGSVYSSLLLGQSFLSRISTWTIDNNKHVFIFSELKQGPNEDLYVYRKPPEAKSEEQNTLQIPSPSPSSLSVSDIESIKKHVAGYYALVQKKDIDAAMDCYSSEKRPQIKRLRLEAVAKDTEYYIINSVNVVAIGQDRATAFTRLTHKKYNEHPEVWEIALEYVRDGNQWKIQGTPGKKVSP
jgi:hypothetical protein